MVGDDKFKIVGREGSLLNIGGYQVNPIYIENVIGVAGTGAVGTVLIRKWSVVNDYQDPNWVLIQVA
jgi:acyl-coenzyme A synthetase/AMP-(fatty) acid ligase